MGGDTPAAISRGYEWTQAGSNMAHSRRQTVQKGETNELIVAFFTGHPPPDKQSTPFPVPPSLTSSRDSLLFSLMR
jgi:hypothetical protein